MANQNVVANSLRILALLGELQKENIFKIRAYSNASRIISKLDKDFTRLYEENTLTKVKGVGKGVLGIIDEIMQGKDVVKIYMEENFIPYEMMMILKISGLGPKRVRTLWKDLNITSLAELEYACNENRLLSLKGFGVKLQNVVIEEIETIKSQQGYIRIDQGLNIANELCKSLENIAGITKISIVGDLKRRVEKVNKIDLLCFVYDSNKGSVLRAIETELDVQLQEKIVDGVKYCFSIKGLFCVNINLYICTEKNKYGAWKILLTGSDGFINNLKTLALNKGYNFNYLGLYRTGEVLDVNSEDNVFNVLNILKPADEEREENYSFVKKGKKSKKLLCIDDLQGSFHNHSVASDGKNTIEEMRSAAIELGLTYLGISDHSKSAFYANGMKDDELISQIDYIKNLNQDQFAEKCFLLTGVESDILADGSLDYPDEVLQKLDIVVSSVHSRLKQDFSQMTARLKNAAENPYTTIIGHPTGRLLLGRRASEFDMGILLDACLKSGCAIELNANPHRLDLNEHHLSMAKERGVMIAINADAHSVEGLKDLRYGVMIARRAGLTAENVLNCMSLEGIFSWLKKRFCND